MSAGSYEVREVASSHGQPQRDKATPPTQSLGKSAARLLAALAATTSGQTSAQVPFDAADAGALISADLATRRADGSLAITAAGRAHLARRAIARNGSAIDPFLGQHLALACVEIETEGGRAALMVDAGESPLAWLARRKGRNGRALIEPVQLQAGERLRADFTRAELMPRTTANWTSAVAQGRRGAGGGVATFTESVIAARQRVRRALAVVGPEFTGLLLDVCCFLKRLEDVERERLWPPRSAKVVLQLGLDRLARHYGYGVAARGAPRAELRTWLAEDAAFAVE